MCLALMVGYPIIRSTHFKKFDRIFKWCVVHDKINDDIKELAQMTTLEIDDGDGNKVILKMR